jgi:hypothetical protein
MGEIRTFTADHLADVSTLYLRVMRGRRGPGGEDLQNYFREVFLTNPWVAPDLPSLVYFDKGTLVGFLGVAPRCMEFHERVIRVAVGSQFMVDRERHRGVAALELLRRFFQGPQDLCFTDGAGEANHKVWTAAGGGAAQLYSFNWLRILRPLQTARSFADRSEGIVRLAAKVAFATAAPVDFLLSKLPLAALRPPQVNYVSTRVTPTELFRCIQELGWREQLKPRYEEASFHWLISQIAAGRPSGELRMATVSTPGGELCGWHVYSVSKRGPAEVLQMGVRRRDHFDGILSALFRDAWQSGAAFVKGQAIPQFLVNLTNQNCLFRQANTSVLFHTRDVALEKTILEGKAALSRLDGECWMRFSTESWT